MRFHQNLTMVLVAVAALAWPASAPGQRPGPSKPAPQQKNVAYGPHERNVLDLWQAKSEKPTPLVVYIHGGGFRAGSKESLNAGTLRELLDAGISVAAVNYRFVSHAPLPAAHHDCRRALQFLRSKAGAWNLDKTRVGAFGGSAGAQLCMYLAFHDDMADRDSDDPIARESTRLTCVATNGGQTTMDVEWWKKHIPDYDAPHRNFFETFGVKTKEEYLKKVADVSALSLISKDDVPIFMTYGMKPDDPVPDDARRARGWKVHHVVFGVKLKEKMDALGIEADLKYPGARTTYRSVSHFFIEKLTKDGKPKAKPRSEAPVRRRPRRAGGRGLARVPDGVKFIADLAYRKGNKKWRLDLAMPEGRGDKLRPAIVFVHGGGWRGGDKGGGQWRSLPLHYASKGYVCISVNYRLTDTAPFPACVEDVKCAVRWLRANAKEYNVDPRRIGAYGNSAGAHLVAMLGLVGPDAKLEGDGPYQDQSSLVQAVCCSATPTDFTNWGGRRDNSFLKRGLLRGPEDTFAARAKKASPLTYVKADAPPFLVVHGANDRTVPVQHGDRFVEALKKAGAKDVTYLRYEGAGHGVFGQHSEETHPAMEKFFARTIGAPRGRAAPDRE
jgi:acetyl esterase